MQLGHHNAGAFSPGFAWTWTVSMPLRHVGCRVDAHA